MITRVCIAILLYFLFLGTTHYKIYQNIENLSNQLEAETKLLADQISMSVSHTALTADALVQSLEKREWSKTNNIELQTFLAYNIQSDIIRHIILFDPNGRQLATSFKQNVPNLDVSDRPYFKFLKEGNDGFWYGPFTGRSSQLPSYAYIRAVHDSTKGELLKGFILSVMSVEYLNQVCARSITSPRTEALLITDDGYVVAGCGLEAKVIAEQPHYSTILTNGESIELKPTPATVVGDHLITVQNVSSAGRLKLAVSIDLNARRMEYIQHMFVYGCALVIVLITLFVRIPTRIART